MAKSYVLWQSGIAACALAVIAIGMAIFRVKKEGKLQARILPGADWDFSDSWASTATLGGAGFALFFGSSDVVAALAGDKATVAPVIVVASAIALALIAVAPLVVKAFSDPTEGESSLAIVVAAWITVSAALFELIVIVWLAEELTALGGWGNWPTKAAGVATGCLLLTYATRSLGNLLESPTPHQAANDAAEAQSAAQAAAIALAVAEAKAVAAAQAESKHVDAESRYGAGLVAQDEVDGAKSALNEAKKAEEKARLEAEEASVAARTALAKSPRRRAALL